MIFAMFSSSVHIIPRVNTSSRIRIARGLVLLLVVCVLVFILLFLFCWHVFFL
jgi:hypothetical protein